MEVYLDVDASIMEAGDNRSVARRGYDGVTAAQRSADRRARLLQATLELVGDRGYRALTVAALRRSTGLNDRYFYEHFRTCDDIFDALIDELAGQTMAAMTAAVAAADGEDLRSVVRATLAACIETLTADQRKARVVFIEAPAHDEGGRRRHIRDMFIALMRAHAENIGAPELGERMQFLGVHFFGALMETTTSWIAGQLRMTRDELVELNTDLLLAAFDHARTTWPVRAD
ncbi:putative transcriptional regulator, TetR family protein [Mycolicibacterium insubricum]|uniref:Uncharacterized protein n=1 Tax=Mycolicibacterium insubricum TaxID=444597 RepID=A0A1X0DHC2_9MYCO|nr:hypothetical protein BST26_06930 [Mycolicibacterium insubricum]BBZ65598.1 putative transcriptional regulator, TetR family protein [Mycolicibacterium insubricum]